MRLVTFQPRDSIDLPAPYIRRMFVTIALQDWHLPRAQDPQLVRRSRAGGVVDRVDVVPHERLGGGGGRPARGGGQSRGGRARRGGGRGGRRRGGRRGRGGGGRGCGVVRAPGDRAGQEQPGCGERARSASVCHRCEPPRPSSQPRDEPGAERATYPAVGSAARGSSPYCAQLRKALPGGPGSWGNPVRVFGHDGHRGVRRAAARCADAVLPASPPAAGARRGRGRRAAGARRAWVVLPPGAGKTLVGTRDRPTARPAHRRPRSQHRDPGSVAARLGRVRGRRHGAAGRDDARARRGS